MAKPILLFRLDGDDSIGAGHMMRSIALAEACQKLQLEPHFVAGSTSRTFLEPIQKRGFPLSFIPDHVSIDQEPHYLKEKWPNKEVTGIVADRYNLPFHYFKDIESNNPKWIRCQLNDWGDILPNVEIVVNQNLGAQKEDYSVTGDTKNAHFLLGSNFSLLRSEILKKEPKKSVSKNVSKILVTLGGGNQIKPTTLIVNALSEVSNNLRIDVVLPKDPQSKDLDEAIRKNPQATKKVGVSDMSELFEEADLTISGAGSTLWEIYYFGIPNIAYVLAANQQRIAEAAQKNGSSLVLGKIAEFSSKKLGLAVEELINSYEKREAMANRQRTFVDGKGADRVCKQLKMLIEQRN